jgi:hypothetical protein
VIGRGHTSPACRIQPGRSRVDNPQHSEVTFLGGTLHDIYRTYRPGSGPGQWTSLLYGHEHAWEKTSSNQPLKPASQPASKPTRHYRRLSSRAPLRRPGDGFGGRTKEGFPFSLCAPSPSSPAVWADRDYVSLPCNVCTKRKDLLALDRSAALLNSQTNQILQ